MQAIPGKYIFDRDVIFYLASVVYWQVTNYVNQQQVDIDNVRENIGKSHMTKKLLI